MATRMPPKPNTLLEKIICDADLDYLGRSDMIPVSNTLYKELKEQDKIGTLNDWNKLQIKFISGHSYFTKTAQSLREVNKQKQIERIKKLITETWLTRIDGSTDEKGELRFRGFLGRYRITTTASGQSVETTCHLTKGARNAVIVRCK